MNISQAKEQIKNAMTAYFTKDEFGAFRIPVEKQRPVFLMGPPGIGKTAIMEQIAQELGVSLISYSMTHHTRQSALGLPFIVHKNYDGLECDVSEYTMSEIIAAVYDMIETTGNKQGILFLDEINCVSETLSPVMLQFLQYKMFGRHKVPDGWIVVTAGNPPEYNNSVREFDIVTWDRLKRIDIEPDFEAWKEYAYKNGVHPAVLTYLEVKRDDFYKIESTPAGKRFITARGWDDLSSMIYLYEENKLSVDGLLISQYIQNESVARSFAAYYDLFNKYREDYRVEGILSGNVSDEVLKRAKESRFDERLALISLMLEVLTEDTRAVTEAEKTQQELLPVLKKLKASLSEGNVSDRLSAEAKALRSKMEIAKLSVSVTAEDLRIQSRVISFLEAMSAETDKEADAAAAFARIKANYDAATAELRVSVDSTSSKLSNAFSFLEKAFVEGQELIVFVTNLTADSHTAAFISRYGCEEYFDHNKELLFYERGREIISRLEQMELEV